MKNDNVEKLPHKILDWVMVVIAILFAILILLAIAFLIKTMFFSAIR